MRKLRILAASMSILAAAGAAHSGAADQIFADGFESGDTASWSANRLAVTTANPQKGNFSLQVTYDGTSTTAVLEDPSPASETVHRVEFVMYLDAAGAFGPAFNMAPGDNHLILLGRDWHAASVWQALLGRQAGGGQRFYLKMFARERGWNRAVGRVLLGTDSWQRITLEWVAASAEGANDGLARITKNMNPQEVTDLDNPFFVIERVQLGVPAGVDTGTTGAYYYDTFESFRTLAP